MTKTIVTDHFRERVKERLRGVDPDKLANAFTDAIDRRHPDVCYQGRNKFGDREPSRRFCHSGRACGNIVAVVSDATHGHLTFLTVYLEAP